MRNIGQRILDIVHVVEDLCAEVCLYDPTCFSSRSGVSLIAIDEEEVCRYLYEDVACEHRRESQNNP